MPLRMRTMMTRTIAASALVAVIGAGVLTGCSRIQPADPPVEAGLPGAALHSWILVRIADAEGTVDDPVPAPTLDLSDRGRVSGSDGCAPLEGTITRTDRPGANGMQEDPTAEIRIDDLVSPAIGCLTTNKIEKRYAAALTAAHSLLVDGERLTLRTDGGTDGASLEFERGDTGATPGPSPSPTPSTSQPDPVPLPPEAARRWRLESDATLGFDLRTPGRIVVSAGCLGYSGTLTTRALPEDPTAGARPGPSVGITITPRADGLARCQGFTPAQQEFVAALGDATELTVVGDRLHLYGHDVSMTLTATS